MKTKATMRMNGADLLAIIGSRQFWLSTFKLTIAIALVLAIAAIALTAFVVLLPIALVGGIALHWYIRRQLRRHPQHSSHLVIDGEYTIIHRP